MTNLRIGVYDDDPAWAEKHLEAVQDGLANAGLNPDAAFPIDYALADEWISPLIERQRKPSPRKDPWAEADILVIDFDLRRSRFQSAEKLAYWLRCYSSCPALLALNMRPQRTFELTLQRTPDAFSWVDLGVYPQDLASADFWLDESNATEYCPWYWPSIQALPERVRHTVRQADANLDKTVSDFFAMPSEIVKSFPRSLLGDYVSSLDTTLDEIATARIHREDREHVPRVGRGRVAAATLRWWLESMVLPPQHVLIDAPHAVSRYPSLLGRPRDALTTLNQLARVGPRIPGKLRALESRSGFARPEWVSRPAWWFRNLSTDPEIKEVLDPQTYAALDWVFAEDSSSFQREEDCEQYSIAISTPFQRRYILRPKDGPSAYEPTSFLMRE